jgi:hypothetical protein
MVWERGYFRPAAPPRLAGGSPVCPMMASPGGLALRDIWRFDSVLFLRGLTAMPRRTSS